MCMQNACYQLPQTCLANQLDDLTVADLARAAAGTTPLYLVGRYGGGTSASTQVLSGEGHLPCMTHVLVTISSDGYCYLWKFAFSHLCLPIMCHSHANHMSITCQLHSKGA